MEKRVK